MKTKNIISFLVISFLLGLNPSFGKDPVNAPKHPLLQKAAIQEWKFFDINTIYCTINSAGPYCDYLRTNSSGLFWPKGTNKTAVFTAGMWVIGKHRPTGLLRTAVQDYSTEFQPGPILTTYNTSTNSVSAIADPTDKKYRIYKVHKKDSVGGNPDYDEWPVDLGAPYIERNGQPGYQKGEDKPFLWGDQVLWCVYNDGNPGAHSATGRTNPMGIEIQTTYFGFDQPGALGNIMFMRWKIINKSDADYDSVFISMWSDTDLGDANDDLSGVDTLRKLAYVYNGDNDDGTASGYGNKPPADGFVFFQGPRVPGQPTDTALFEGKKIAGSKNLPGTSHVVYFNGGGGLGWNDPPLGNVAFAEQAYNYQNGLLGPTGAQYINPQTNQPSKFVFPGDPVTNTGWIHTNTATPQDVRSMISSGPFTLAKGDTQEIVGGFVIAQGADRLNSIAILRLYTAVAQEAFDVNFALASPPPQPKITVGELPNKIVLNWGNPTDYEATESYNFKGAAKDYKFEGYNVYQLKGPSSTFEAKLIATYDLVNNVKTVYDYVFDQTAGVTLYKPVVYGNDYGIKRYFVFDKDYFTNEPLINGKEYYYAVTSYAYNHDPNGVTSGIPPVLENSKQVIIAIPRGVAAGDQITSSTGQTLLSNRAINGDDAVQPYVINPRQITGGTYKVIFSGIDTNVTSWSLVKTTLSKGNLATATDTVVKNNTNFSGDDMSPVVDGIMWRVTKPQAGPRRDSQSPRGYRYYPSDANMWFTAKTGTDALGNLDSTLGRSIGYPTANNFVSKASKVKPWELKKVEIRFSKTNTQKAYRYVDFNAPAFGALPVRDSSFIPYLKHRGAAGAFIYQDYVDVPFTVWEIDSLDGSPAPRQLNVGFLEKNDSIFAPTGEYVGRGAVDGKWGPTHAPLGGSEMLFIFASNYSSDTLVQYTRDIADTNNNTKFMNLRTMLPSVDMYYVIWVKRKDSTATFKEGDRFVITPNYPLLASREYNTVVPKNIKNDPKLISQDIAKINVFPNPYFASNKAETNTYQRFVTFNNLPTEATIQIFNLAGERIQTIVHNNTTGFERWYLRNEAGLPVASGIYIAHIKIPNAGDRILKIAIIQPEERPTR